MNQSAESNTDAARLAINVLGGFSVSVDSRHISDSSWKLKKAKAVIKLLAIAPGNRIHRDVVLDVLWPDLEPEAALNNLHKALYVVRRALEPGVSGSGDFVRFQEETLSLDSAAGLEVDCQQFDSLAKTALAKDDLASFQAALGVYKAELLPDDRYEEWSISKRDELAQTFQSLLVAYADMAEAHKDTDEAISALQRLIAVEPGLESAHMRLMKLFAGSGDRHRAIRQYQSLVKTLDTEFGLEPQGEIEALYDEIVGGRTSFSRPAAAVQSVQHNTPFTAEHQANPFVPAGPALVGREAELQQISPALDDFSAGTGSVVLLSGPAGVGKSRFAEEIAAKASTSGAQVMRGSAYEFERQVPYGPFSEALDDFVLGLPEQQSRGIMDAAPIDIFPLLPKTALRFDRVSQTTESHDRPFLFSAIESLLRSLAASAPVVMILDDLHAADESALELFHFLGRQSRSMPLLLIVTYRSEGEALNNNFARALAALNRIGVGTRVTLDSLDEESVRSIVSTILPGDVPDEIVSAVFTTSEGNPLYVEETVRTMLESGSISSLDEKWTLESELAAVPETISSILIDRIERFDDQSRQLLSAAAVIGTETPYPLLRAVSGLDEDDVLDALDVLLQRHILVEAEDGYRFSHGLHRDVAYEAMSQARRWKIHYDVAQSIMATKPGKNDENAEHLAHHLLSANKPAVAVPYLIAAGHKAASVFANEEALKAFSRALEIIQDGPAAEDPLLSGNLLDAMGDVQARIGNARESLDLYKQSMMLLEPVEPMAGFKVRGKAALAAINAEQVEEGEQLLESILANISPEMPDFAISRTYLLLAQIGWHSADHSGAIESAEKALEAALSSGDDTEAARAYEAMARASPCPLTEQV